MILLGSTGSIGVNALNVAKAFGISVESMCAGSNIALLNKQITQFHPKRVCIANKQDSSKLVALDYKLYFGESGIEQMIADSSSKLVLNALVGFMGLSPSLKALECGKALALANKESLVAAGWLFQNANITPIDSEHFALWYLATNRPKDSIEKLYITASGGALRDYPLESIQNAKLDEVLAHPNWQMGRKITIDSATMVNKLFEVLEARWLFDMTNIDALIEPSSTIHGLIAFKDGSFSAHLSSPDMKLPIAFALDKAKALDSSLIAPLHLETLSLNFKPICTKRYPLWSLKEHILQYPKLGIVLNASNEVALNAFVEQKIAFGDISALILAMIEKFDNVKMQELSDLESIKALDSEVRSASLSYLAKLKCAH